MSAKPCLLLLLSTALSAQTPGPQQTTFHSTFDGTDQPYILYLPHLEPGASYPLIVSLHAEESTARLNLRRIFGRGMLGSETEGEFLRRFPTLPDVPYLVACPQQRDPYDYRGPAERDLYDLLADLRHRFPVDDDRVYLTGISTGGSAALWLGLTRPDLWAAVAPVSAEPTPGIDSLAGNAIHLPILLFHGDQDPLVPPAFPRQLLKRFLHLDVPAEYTEYPGLRHNAFDRAYRNAAIFPLFARFQRQRFPDRVRFSTAAYKYDSAYWLRLDRFTPGTLATVDARFTASNRIEVTTQDLDGFTLTLAGHPKFSLKAPLTVIVDGAELRPKGRDTVSFVRSPDGWTYGSAPTPGSKRKGLEGPLSEAIDSPHIYVYGTADAPSEAVLERRRHLAAAAADWSTPRVPVPVHFPIKADREVTAADLAANNLILFGKRQTNSLIARFAPLLPIQLNSSAADFGLVFIAPVGSHYVLIDEGLPWWMGADQVKGSGWRQVPAPFHVLQGFGDYVLFKGSLDHVVAEGRFDRNWKLPDAAARIMQTAGVVTVPSCCQKNSANTATR